MVRGQLCDQVCDVEIEEEERYKLLVVVCVSKLLDPVEFKGKRERKKLK